MKVLFVTGLTGYGIGGARTEEIRLVSGAAARGLDVAMCSDVLAGELAGTKHYRLDYPPGANAPRQLAEAIEAFKPDLVHVVGGGVKFLIDCNAAMKSVPWVFTAHNVPPAEKIFSRLHGHPLLHYAVRNALALPSVMAWKKYLKGSAFRTAICHSRTVARRLVKVGCPASKVSEIPFGSELILSPGGEASPQALSQDLSQVQSHPLSQMPPASSQEPPKAPSQAALQASSQDSPPASSFPADAWPKILTIAGLAHHKAQHDGILMAAELVKDFPKLSYRLIGMSRDGTYQRYLEELIAKLGLSNHVSLIHSAPEDVKFAALGDADLYVQPSHEEGFCIAFLEAATLVPRLIGADTGAIAEMAEGDATARVVPPGKPAALAAAARELLKIKADAATTATRAAALRRRYSWDAYLDAHLGVYQQTLGITAAGR